MLTGTSATLKFDDTRILTEGLARGSGDGNPVPRAWAASRWARGWGGRGRGKEGEKEGYVEGPGKWSAPGPALALGGPARGNSARGSG